MDKVIKVLLGRQIVAQEVKLNTQSPIHKKVRNKTVLQLKMVKLLIVKHLRLNVQDSIRCLIKKVKLYIQQQLKVFICHALHLVLNASKEQIDQNQNNNHYHRIT